jgi:phosphoribosyl-AMP cyclohydrolase
LNLAILKIADLDFKKNNGLIPVIVQDCRNFEVLTLVYVNKEALLRTLETKYAHYFMGTQEKVIQKGITSGHYQRVIEILVDCDQDTLIFLVEQKGLACHLWRRSCFHNSLKEAEILRG